MSTGGGDGRGARARPLAARLLTAEAFAPYGAVLATPETAGVRTYFDAALGPLSPQVPASLSIIHAVPVAARPVPVEVIERHPLTSQSFLPMAPARWVVVVAPDRPGGGPDLERAEAFLPPPGAGITLQPGIWHAPLTVLDAAAPFAILMWRDWSPNDEEFAAILPFAVTV